MHRLRLTIASKNVDDFFAATQITPLNKNMRIDVELRRNVAHVTL